MNTRKRVTLLRSSSIGKKVLTVALALIFIVSTATTLSSIKVAFAADSTFSIIWITDTQHSAKYYPSDFDTQCSWIVNNTAALNVKAVIHTGDIVDTATSPSEWTNANHSMSLLLNNNIPYCWDAGNHDQYGTTFYGGNYAAFNVNISRGKQYWVSDYNHGRNTAIRVNVSNLNILIVNVEFHADAAAVQWANNLLDSNPSSLAIVGTHSYLDPSCNYNDWATNFRATALDTHPNVFLTLSGHHAYPTGNRTKIGNRNELVFDRQGEDAMRGGASIRVLAFDTAKNTINVTTYVPYENRWLTDPDSKFTLDNVVPIFIPEFTPSTMLTILLAATLLSALALRKELVSKRLRRTSCGHNYAYRLSYDSPQKTSKINNQKRKSSPFFFVHTHS